MKPSRLPLRIALVCGITPFLASCASIVKTSPTAGPAERKILDPSEYDSVYVTGSNLPVLVPKSSTAQPLPLASDVSNLSPEAFRDLVQRGQSGHH